MKGAWKLYENSFTTLTPEQQTALKARLSPSHSGPAAPSAALKRKMPVALRPPALRKHFRFRHLLRAGDRTRTGDVQLGKLAFYQLNYARGNARKSEEIWPCPPAVSTWRSAYFFTAYRHATMPFPFASTTNSWAPPRP